MARKNNSIKPSRESKAIKLPSREAILAYIEENPGESGKRELAKAFNLKGDARIWLKDVLKQLTDDGVIEKRRKSVVRAGSLPPITVVKIYSRDADGDFLAHPAEWNEEAAPPIVVLSPRRHHGDGPVVGVGDKVLAKIFANKRGGIAAYSGRIVRKLEDKEQTVLGVLQHLENGEWRANPIDRREGEIKLDTTGDFFGNAGDLVEISINKNNRLGLKRGVIREVVGRIDSEKALSMIAIISHEIPHIFPAEVLQEAEQAKAPDWDHREDWRELAFVTIDPADAKDHDDAVYAVHDDDENNPGGFIVYVAIADVAYYIRPHSALDREALKRGNSVYFPDRVVPMLPERISNNLCSLRENEDRPALVVRMIYDANGNKKKHDFHRVMIRSIAKLSYGQAQAAIDGLPDEKTAPLLDAVLKPLWAAYEALKSARKRREPLDLDLPEKKIILDEKGRVQDVIVPERLDAHRLIEEFMISANVAAAETLEQKHSPLIYRIHDQPSLAKQEALREFLHTLGMSLARGADLTPSRFNQILKQVEHTEKQELVNQVVLRTQSQAEYNRENIGHYGLRLLRYAHFTSPIRRYADLTIHRALIKALNFGIGGLIETDPTEMDAIATLISSTERRAMAAERETVDRLIAHYLADKVGANFSGRIGGVTKAGLFITLDRLGADGFVPISSLGNDYYHFDEARHALTGSRTHKGYQLGDIVEVRLTEALPIAGALRFEMLSQPRDLPFSPASYHKSKKRPISARFRKKK